MRYDQALPHLRQNPAPQWGVVRRTLQAIPLARQAHKILRSATLTWHKMRHISSGGNIVSVVVDVPQYCGKFETDPRGHLFSRLVAHRWEPHLASFVHHVLEDGDDIIDVGANIGLFTVLAAKTAAHGRVLAVEPSPDAAVLLSSNIRRNELENVIVFHGAASACSGSETLNTIPGFTEYSSLGEITHPAVANRDFQPISVAARTVDDLVEENQLQPKLVKIDVEGAEHDVLRGLSTTLERFRPLLICELDDGLLPNRGTSAAAVCEYLAEKGYEFFDVETAQRLAEGARFVGEIVALPREYAGSPSVGTHERTATQDTAPQLDRVGQPSHSDAA
jgi:FkbM family methyltransferase